MNSEYSQNKVHSLQRQTKIAKLVYVISFIIATWKWWNLWLWLSLQLVFSCKACLKNKRSIRSYFKKIWYLLQQSYPPSKPACTQPPQDRTTAHQALLVEIWWDSPDSTPSYDELGLVIPFASLRWWTINETAFVMTGENKNEFYMET